MRILICTTPPERQRRRPQDIWARVGVFADPWSSHNDRSALFWRYRTHWRHQLSRPANPNAPPSSPTFTIPRNYPPAHFSTAASFTISLAYAQLSWTSSGNSRAPCFTGTCSDLRTAFSSLFPLSFLRFVVDYSEYSTFSTQQLQDLIIL